MIHLVLYVILIGTVIWLLGKVGDYSITIAKHEQTIRELRGQMYRVLETPNPPDEHAEEACPRLYQFPYEEVDRADP